jgi:hypothetical protein
MESEIAKLENEFLNIKNLIYKIIDTKNSIKQKLSQLKDIHGDIIKDNNSKKIFLICLESFHFQYKVMMFDMDNLQRKYLLLTNRTYCDYFNLYKLLYELLEEYKIEIPTETQHPVYKDLEPFHEYSLEDIDLVYRNVIQLIMCLISKLRFDENTVNKYKYKSLSGIRIANFINTLEYDNNILRDQITLYINYCDFFETTQLKYFSKMFIKVKSLYDEIAEDIKLHETPWDTEPISEDDTLTQVSEDCMVSQWGVTKEEMEKSENIVNNAQTPTETSSPVPVASIPTETSTQIPTVLSETSAETGGTIETSDSVEMKTIEKPKSRGKAKK